LTDHVKSDKKTTKKPIIVRVVKNFHQDSDLSSSGNIAALACTAFGLATKEHSTMLAAIDLGSNSFHLHIGIRDANAENDRPHDEPLLVSSCCQLKNLG